MKLQIMAILSITLLSGCAYQSGVLEDRAAEKTATPSTGATAIDTPAAAPINTPPNSAASSAQRMISPLTGG
ncbi:MAG: hypothetical protein P4M14_04375 [Gammaproteobacteria bacterium]|nr:hypothetical protein [Gammaproteobacteria bacterium]